MSLKNFENFIDDNYFLKSNETTSPRILIPQKQAFNDPSTSPSFKFSNNLLGHALKAKMNNIVLSEKKLFYEIYQKLVSEEKKELTTRERELLQELASVQAKMIILETEFKEQKNKHSELLERNLNFGKQVQNLLDEREDFLKVDSKHYIKITILIRPRRILKKKSKELIILIKQPLINSNK